jgi:hypothetical protein
VWKAKSFTGAAPSSTASRIFLAAWKYQQKLNLQRRSPVGVQAVIVPDLDQLAGEGAARHELAGVVELLAGYSVDEVFVMTGLDASFVHAVYAVYYGARS